MRNGTRIKAVSAMKLAAWVRFIMLSSAFIFLVSGTAEAQSPVTITQIHPDQFETTFKNHFNVARAGLGAKVRASVSLYGSTSEHLITIQDKLWNGAGSGEPSDIDIILPGEAAIQIGGFSVSNDVKETRFELLYQTAQGNGSWHSLGMVSMGDPSFLSANTGAIQARYFSFSHPVKAHALRLSFKESSSIWYRLYGVEVYARANNKNLGLLPDALVSKEINLAAQWAEGGLIRYPGADKNAQKLVDGSEETLWTAPNQKNDLRFTFMFDDFRTARIARVELVAPSGQNEHARPGRATVLAGNGPSPLDGMRAIKTAQLTWQSGKAVIDLPANTKARFLEVRLTNPSPTNKLVALAQINIVEDLLPGKPSILFISEAVPTAKREENKTQATGSDVEQVPDNSPKTARPLALEENYQAALWPESDVDFLSIDVPSRENTSLSLSLTADGGPMASFAIGTRAQTGEIKFNPLERRRSQTLQNLPSAKYFLRVNRPENSSIVVVIDDSNSMADQKDNIMAAFKAFLETKRPQDEVAILLFSSDDAAALSDFETDPDILLQRLQGNLGNGGSPVYASLSYAANLLRERKGNRAIILLSDGANSGGDGSIEKTWQRLETGRMRFYGIGFGSDLMGYTDYAVPQRARRLLQAWAQASGGIFALAPTGKAMQDVFVRIAEDFRHPSRYRVMPTLRKTAYGAIKISSEGLQISGADAPTIELILDASGSMSSKKHMIQGRLRIDVAKDVLGNLISTLPNGVKVGLRIFGETVREGSEGDCYDVKLVRQHLPLDGPAKKKMIERVRSVKPLGTTPIYTSLLLALGDLAELPGKKVVIIVTDGKEECRDPEELWGLAAGAKDFGVDMRLEIVGFDLEDEATKQTLSQAAEVTGGHFFDAGNGKDLAHALKEAFTTLTYDLIKPDGSVAVSGRVDGESIRLKEGSYAVNLLAATGPIRIDNITVREGQLHEIVLGRKNGKLDSKSKFKKLPQ